jgi:hypothetical protein
MSPNNPPTALSTSFQVTIFEDVQPIGRPAKAICFSSQPA